MGLDPNTGMGFGFAPTVIDAANHKVAIKVFRISKNEKAEVRSGYETGGVMVENLDISSGQPQGFTNTPWKVQLLDVSKHMN